MTQDQEDYVHNQTVKYMSHEDENPGWKNGQFRFINHFLLPIIDRFIADCDEPPRILDAGCGDGAGMTYLRELGIRSTVGLDLSDEKRARATIAGNDVYYADLHEIPLASDRFDIVYSSHCLEHCHTPHKVVAEFRRVAKPAADFVIVLPFPDNGPEDAHCGSMNMGTRTGDLELVKSWFRSYGLETVAAHTDSYREPEVWFHLRKTQ